MEDNGILVISSNKRSGMTMAGVAEAVDEYLKGKYIYCIDLDGTVCNEGVLYQYRKPYTERIKIINELYDAGHYIKLFTARGSRNGLDFRAMTELQLKEWGLKYHELIFGKPHADIYVDNNTKTPVEFFGKTDCVRVVVSGGFDPVHIGHLRLFQKAREFGDKLIVILNKDEFVMRKKGYVLMPLAERKEILESCKYVDEVVVSIDDDKSVSKTIEMIRPQYFVKSGDRKGESEKDVCEKVGCERVYIDFDEETKSHSSSKIVGKVRGGIL